MRIRLLLIALALLLAACAPASEVASSTPSLHIALSYAAQAERPALLACIPAEAADQFGIDLVLANGADIADYNLLIRLGEPRPIPEFAVQLGQDQIAVVVNSSIPLRELSRAQLADLFSGRVTDWGALGGEAAEVHLWVPLAGDEARTAFQGAVLQGSEFSGEAQLAASPDLMIAAIAADPHAVGLLPASLVPEELRAISTGLDVPVLAVAGVAPSGALLSIVGCLQGEDQ